MLNESRKMFFLTIAAVLWPALLARAQTDAAFRSAPHTDLPRNTYSFTLQQKPEPPAAESPPLEPESALTSLNWEIDGPIRLRSADPEPPGEVVIKNIFEWSTSSDGSDDDVVYEFEVEYGLIQNHELIFEIPVELGDGFVDGNADIELGWHWRLWEEQDWLPAFAMRNFVRLPSGVGSDGVDYEWIGLFTKSLVPGALRLNVNPYLKSVNGSNEEDALHLQWGSAIGLDYRLSEEVLLVGAYHYGSAEIEHFRDQHALELDAEWEFAEHQKVCVATEIGLDGDSEEPNVGVILSYVVSFGVGTPW